MLRRHGLPLLAMAAATAAFAGPLLPRLTTHVPGSPRTEVWGHLWALWLPGHNLFVEGASPLRATLVNCPDGVGFYTNDPVHAVVVTALRPALGLVASYDVMMILAVAAVMVATYTLALELARSRAAAAAAGIAAGLSPYVRSSFIDGYSEGMGLFWAALLLTLLLRLLRAPSWRDAALCGGCFAAVFYSDLYTTIGAAVAYCCAAATGLLLRPAGARARLARLLAGPLLGLLLAIPGMLALRAAAPPIGIDEATAPPEATGALHHLPPAAQCWQTAGRRAAVDLAALLPSAELDPSCDVPLRRAVYPGLIAQLCLLGVALRRPRRRLGLLVGALASLLLSGGIYLTFRGEVLTVGGEALMGPAGLAARALPAVWGMNSLYRFSSVYTLVAAASLAVPAAWLLRHGLAGRGAAAALIVAALVDVLAFGHVPFPTPVTDAQLSEAYRWMRHEPGDGAVLEWPVQASWDPWPANDVAPLPDEKVLFHQTVHHRCFGWPGPSAWLYFSAHPEADVPRDQRPAGQDRWGGGAAAALLTDLTTIAVGQRADARPALAEELVAADIHYVVLHTERLGAATRTRTRAYLDEALGTPRAFDRGIEVYRLTPGSSE